MNLKKFFFYLGGLIIVGMLVLIIYMYPFYHFFFTEESIVIDKDLTVISGAGNTAILVTDSAVVVIDTKMRPMAKKLFSLAKEKAGNKKVIVINTHFHGDHINGNQYFINCPIYIGGYDTAFARKNIEAKNRPTVFIKDSLILPLGNETLALYNLGQGHTYADLVVYFKNRKLLFSGDLVFNQVNPALMKDDGTDIEKWKMILDQVPRRWVIQTVVPGHGKPGGAGMMAVLKQYFTDMQEAASNPHKTSEIKARYKDWMNMPLMASPDRTINFIKGN